MDKTTNFSKKIINEYLEKISSQIKVEGVLLFGSYAYGQPDKHSDVDLIVVSPDFEKMNDRLFWLTQQREGVATGVAMDIFGYTPEEFANIEKESAVMGYAKKHGQWLIEPSNL